jgi:hypothetical protein
MLSLIPDSGSAFQTLCSPRLDNILAGPGIKKDEAHGRMVEQTGNHNQIAALMDLRGS